MDGRLTLREKQRNFIVFQIKNQFKGLTAEKKKLEKYAKSFLEHLHNTGTALCSFGLSLKDFFLWKA